MDYKKIIKSRSMRIKIMQALSFIPDKTMLQIQYQIKLRRKLNLKNPQRYTEKLQWYKLYYRDPL
ncbi:MAG: carbonic anhydrase, partial [Ruthenibacterium sp.]